MNNLANMSSNYSLFYLILAINWEEMLRTFNLGIGIVIVLHQQEDQTAEGLFKKLNDMYPESFTIGKVVRSGE